VPVDGAGPNFDNDPRGVPEMPSDVPPLKLLGHRRFVGFEPHQVVTFLNQTLKAYGLVFGVRMVPGGYELSVYDAEHPHETDAP